MKKLKASNRGLTFSLNEEQIDIGTHFRYTIDNKNKTIVITPDKHGTNTVSKKKSGNKLKPLFDLRSKEVKELVSTASYMEVEVRENDIIVYTYQKTKARFRLLKGKKCLLSEVLGVKTGQIIVPIKMAAGNENYQYTIEDYLNSLVSTASYTCSTNEVKQTSKDISKIYDVVSLFSGAGLFDKAWLDDGRFRFVYANDCCEDVKKTYEYNIGKHMVCKDIREVQSSELPFADLYISSPPCTGYSNSNRQNIDSEISEKERLLIEEVVRLVNDSNERPKVVVIENVPTILSKKDGLYLSKIITGLSDYEITTQVVSDVKSGGYTTRERAIIIASKIGPINIPQLDVVPHKTVKDAFDKVDATWYNYNDISKSNSETIMKMSYVPQGGNWTSIPESVFKFKAETHSDRYYRLDPNKVSPTINNFRKVCIIHPFENRIISVSEAAALMGLDKTFKFFGKLSACQQMVCNGVTQAIGRVVKNTVLKALDRHEEFALAL